MAQAENAQQAAAPKKARAVGVVKAISANSLTVQTDAGSEMRVTIQPSTRLVRMDPGQTDLKSAPAIPLSEVQVGDRILAGGMPSDDGRSLTATTAVIMTKSAVAEKQQHDREEWQKNGVGGVVKLIDPAAGSIVLSTGAMGTSTVTVSVAKNTIIRRYAPNSVKFDDARPGTLEQIKVGDQLRARGKKSEDGKELAAAEIVSGSFRSIAATFVSADTASNSITVTDLVSRRPVTLKIASDSQMHQLPEMFAQRIAMRLKGSDAGGTSAAPTANSAGAPPAATGPAGGEGQPHPGTGFGSHNGGSPDFQQMLTHMPRVNPGELQKGSALMIVATEGTADEPSQVVILLSGVEPILTAASPRQASTILSPWNLSAGGNAGTGDAP